VALIWGHHQLIFLIDAEAEAEAEVEVEAKVDT
jgi:hypothetical protein